MRNTRLQYWLARHKPHALVAVDEDGKEYKLSVSKKKNRWALVGKAVAACNAVKLMAYDEKGELVTSCDIQKNGEAAPDEDEEVELGFDPTAKTVPKGFDFASILATTQYQANQNAIEAADRAVARMEEAYAGRRDDMREAMNQFAVVVKLTTDRLVHLERAWHTLLLRQQELGGEGDPVDAMALKVIDKAFGGDGSDKSNGKTNGAHERTQKPPKPEPLT